MQQELEKRAERYNKQHRKKKRWVKLVSVLGSIVVFCTTYALILPAITLDKGPVCGLTEHQHDASCYLVSEAKPQLICGETEAELHVHEDACYEQVWEYVCGLEEESGHTHGDECYTTEETLICDEEESELHTHGNECYTTEEILFCEETEGEGHIHTDACLGVVDQILVCEETGGHVHTDECYQAGETESVLICDRIEHVHSESCMPKPDDNAEAVEEESVFDESIPNESVEIAEEILSETEPEESLPAVTQPTEALETEAVESVPYDEASESNAEMETEAVEEIESSDPIEEVASDSNAEETDDEWIQALVDVELTEKRAENLAAIAKSQLGYEESYTDFIIGDDGKKKGYTWYGDWYGEPYGDWNTMFIAFCMNYAEISESEIPFDTDCEEWIAALQEEELYYTDSSQAEVGDIVFLDRDGDGTSDWAGIIRKLRDMGGITTIEGDVENSVKTVIYAPGDGRISGFAAVNDEEEPVVSVKLQDAVLSAEIYQDDTYSEMMDSEIIISISGMLPEDVSAKAYPVHAEIEDRMVICAYDITLFHEDGSIYEPDGEHAITVSFKQVELPEEEDGDYSIYYVPESGEPEKVDNTEVAGDEVSFITSHFSVYALTSELKFSDNINFSYNEQKDAFLKDAAYAKYYNSNSPIGTAGSFHVVGFDSVYLNTHTNGNVLAKKLYASSNFGTNNYTDELSYVQEYMQVNSNSASSNDHVLVIGSNNILTAQDNGNAFGINGTKVDKPKNLIMDADTYSAPFIDLVRVENEIRQISSNLDGFEDGGVIYQKDPNGQFGKLTLEKSNGVGVVSYTASELSDIAPQSNLKIDGFESGENGTVIINVDCAGESIVYLPNALIYVDGEEQSTAEVIEFSNGKVIWNFLNADGVTIEAKRMTGMVIAPGATVVATQNLNGTIVADNVYVKAETHRTDFTGKVTEPDFEPEVDEYYVYVKKIKTGYAGVALAGAEFDLYEWDGEDWVKLNETSLVTGEDGIVALRKLTPDTAYKLQETKAPIGYVLSDGAFEFWVRSSESGEISVLAPDGFSGQELDIDDTLQAANDELVLNETTSLTIRKDWYTSDGEVYEYVPIDSISVEIYRSSDLNPEEEELYRTVTMTKLELWQLTVDDLPLNAMAEDGTIMTYTYTVKEIPVEDFVTEYSNEEGIHVISNTQIPYQAEFPQTGGSGVHWYILCGLSMTMAALICGIGQRHRQEGGSDRTS